jgi:hypothetical protein
MGFNPPALPRFHQAEAGAERRLLGRDCAAENAVTFAETGGSSAAPS